jgi:hypothetical protein
MLTIASAAVFALFIRSIFMADRVKLNNVGGSSMLFAKFGVLAVSLVHGLPPLSSSRPLIEHFSSPEKEIDWRHLTTSWASGFFENPITHDFWHMGFRFTTISGAKFGGSWRGVWLQVPDWFIFLCLSAKPGRKLIRRFVGRKVDGHNTCGKCGYDLRASEDRCPECGSPFNADRNADNK